MSERNVGEKYTYQKKDLLGHGAFAAVFKGKCKEVSHFLFLDLDHL